MISLRLLSSFLLGFTLMAAGQSAPETHTTSSSAPLLGYSTKTTSDEQSLERRFQDAIVATTIRENMRRLSARPHHVGSPYDKDNAEWMLAQFKAWGFDAQIETFDVLFPTPKERVVELVEPTKFTRQTAGARVPDRSHFEPDLPNSFPPTTPIRSMAT